MIQAIFNLNYSTNIHLSQLNPLFWVIGSHLLSLQQKALFNNVRFPWLEFEFAIDKYFTIRARFEFDKMGAGFEIRFGLYPQLPESTNNSTVEFQYKRNAGDRPIFSLFWNLHSIVSKKHGPGFPSLILEFLLY